MGLILPAFPEIPCHSFTVTLGEAQYNIRMTWRDRTQSWYMDLYDVENNPLALGKRLAPGWAPLAGTLRDPEGGYFYVSGEDGYKQEDLGKTLQVIFYTMEEIGERQPNSLVKSVEIIS